jgi:hypothetical protein
LKSILTILSTTTAVTDLLADGASSVFAVEAVQGAKLPYLIVDIEDSTPNNTKSGDSTLDMNNLRVFSIAERLYTNGSTVGANNLSDEVRSAIAYVARGVYGGESLEHCSWQGQTNYSNKLPNKPQTTVEQDYILSITR